MDTAGGEEPARNAYQDYWLSDQQAFVIAEVGTKALPDIGGD
jgi:hypothetical protein